MFRIKFSREIALKLLYQLDVTDQILADTEIFNITNHVFLKGANSDEKEFIQKIITYVRQNLTDIDQAIGAHLIGWKITRLSPVDRNLLRMGMAEASFNDQRAIVIDDVVRIAKKYGDKDSFKVINAILDKVLK
jgi:N utilization substance protein B